MTFRININITNGSLSIDLFELLQCLEPLISDFSFKMEHVEVTTKTDQAYARYNYLDNKDHSIHFQELKQLAEETTQVIDGVFIGKKGLESICIEAFDSSYWEVTSSIEGVESLILATFQEVEYVIDENQ